jgi:hypothetical protein
MKIEIRNIFNGKIIISGKYESIKDALKKKSGADLSMADLRGADLRGADLSWANLSGADLRGADLLRADLSGADLRWADLRWANLSGADLRWVNLSGVDLSWVDLRGVDLRWVNLSGVNLDFSCLPLSCGGLHWKIDRRIFAQLAYHLCSMDVDDNDCKKLQNKMIAIANEMHRPDVPRLEKKN